MSTIWGSGSRFCDGISRRNFLSFGACGLGALSLADAMRRQAQGAALPPPRSVIIICLPGGPSHIDLYDMKPQAPSEFRGELRPIATNVPGIEISELLPLQAQIADKFAIIRSLQFQTTPPNDHDAQEVFTGFPPNARRPPFGSVVSRLQPTASEGLPPYISLRGHLVAGVEPEAPLYAGLAHGPFEPSGKELNDLRPQSDVGLPRLRSRVTLLEQFDSFRRDLDQRGTMAGMDAFTRRAVEMIATPAVRTALDIELEPEHVRRKYGPDLPASPVLNPAPWMASRFLLARRLVEAGVPVVTLAVGNWDHHGILSNGPHGGIYERLREEGPRFDQALHALLTDLDERGLLDRTAVVVWGEMGRTPRLNRQVGRDHWQNSGFALVAGGGFQVGQVVGATDSRGERPATRPISAQNVFATLYRFMGIDPAIAIPNFQGRPRHLLDDCEPIRELGA